MKVGVAGKVQPPQAVLSPLGFETVSSPQQLLRKGAVDCVLVPILSTLERLTSAAPKDPQVRSRCGIDYSLMPGCAFGWCGVWCAGGIGCSELCEGRVPAVRYGCLMR